MSSHAPLFRSLASMHRAGVPWPQAFQSAARGDERLQGAQRALDRGATLGEALADVVDPLDAALIAAGEQDGSLDTVLENIADTHEDTSRRGTEGWIGLLYPVLLAHVAALLMPIPDLVQGNVGDALFWVVLILGPTWAFLLLRRWLARRARPKPQPHRMPPPTPPLVGPLRNGVEEADSRALDALGRLYDAGVPLAAGIDLAMQAGWGGRVALDLADARRRVARGDDLSGSWTRLPVELADRLRVGEESGSLGLALRRVADSLRFDVAMRRKRMAVILPVVAMLLVGSIIAWRIFSFYGAMYSNIPR